MNTQFLLALKRYLEYQHVGDDELCLVCGNGGFHSLGCPVGNLIKEIDNALVVAVRRENG